MDPTRYCPLYLTEGCYMVDGMLCDVKQCSLLKDFLKNKKVDFGDNLKGWVSHYDNGYVYINTYDYLDTYALPIKKFTKKMVKWMD